MPKDNELWLKRWNTLKNYINNRIENDVDEGDSSWNTLREVQHMQEQIEELE